MNIHIYHHNDDDGRCAAAIVNMELINPYNVLTAENFIEYAYGDTIKHPNWDNDEEIKLVYIVDLSLNDVIYDLIQDCLDHSCKVVYIDHHKTTPEYMVAHPIAESDLFTYFHRTGVSACMLTWVYGCMNSEERKHPNSVEFDFAEGYSHVKINNVEYRIPMAIRFIDDNDVWRHGMKETRMFREGFKMEEDKYPFNTKLWNQLLYQSEGNSLCMKYVNNGLIIDKYNKVTDKVVVDNVAFEYELDGIKLLCLNYYRGNSDVFDDKYHEYPAVIKYTQVGLNKWKYTMYSTEHPVNGVEPVDVSQIAKKYGGGGHEHAAGFSLPYNLFNDAVYVATDKGNATKDYVESVKKQYRPVLQPGA